MIEHQRALRVAKYFFPDKSNAICFREDREDSKSIQNSENKSGLPIN